MKDKTPMIAVGVGMLAVSAFANDFKQSYLDALCMAARDGAIHYSC